jgi:CheY-like chemotaxis protein
LKGRVLVVDDEPKVRNNLKEGLARENYVAVACPDGISAIHELEKASRKGTGYDCLVTDIFMPDIDGLKIMRVVRSRYPDLPVVVITGFGDDRLKSTVLSESNTAYLEKPFRISDLLEAIKDLSPGTTAVQRKEPREPEAVVQDSVSAYVTVKINDDDRSMDIFRRLHDMNGIRCCEAVRGENMDIILVAAGESRDDVDDVVDEVRSMQGLEVSSVSMVKRPELDRDVERFMAAYERLEEKAGRSNVGKGPGTTSCFIVDLDKKKLQKIFATVFFMDEVLFCDVIEDGTKLVGMVTSREAAGRMPRIMEKLSRIDGVLRVREAKVINLMEG